MARIVAGALKGLQLEVPGHIRATEEKVRQALFNFLGDAVHGSRVLDAFAGSGALGLEALSRGARRVVFLEAHRPCLEAIQQNIARASARDLHVDVEVVRGNALSSLEMLGDRAETFDLILLDPPYVGDWGKKALNVITRCGILARSGVVCLEHARQSELPVVVGSLTLARQHRYGDTVLSLYRGTPKMDR